MKRSLLALLFVLGTSTAAFAQLGEIWLSFGRANTRDNSLGAFPLETGGTTDLEQKTSFRFSPRFTINNESHFGHEFGYAYNRGKVEAGGADFFNMSIHQGMYNFLLYATQEGSVVRPFATGGVHFSSFYPPGASVFGGNGITKFGFNYGGGVKVRAGDKYAVRLDIRDYWQGKPDFGLAAEGMLKMLEISAGFGIVF
jgi:hypothetical protein